MVKRLSEMTLEELWQLFPIILTAPDPRWAEWYAQEEALLRRILPAEYALRITHIGSTAIPGIWAKPIVDILVECAPEADLTGADAALACAGYRCMSRGNARRSYNKGYTEVGFAEQVFHLHLQPISEAMPDEVLFRDWLIAHPEDAAAYEALKQHLCEPFRHDRDGYTAAKADFVQEVLHRSRAGG